MKHSEYWRKRFEQLEESLQLRADDYYNNLKKQYNIAMSNIEKDILVWYSRFSDNNNISLSEAKRMLKGKELDELKWTLEEYIKYGKENSLNQRWITELENASCKAHIDRLESLKLQMRHQIETLYDKQTKDTEKLIRDIYTEGYYHTAYEIAKGTKIANDIFRLDTNKINKVINQPWASDGLNFSERIWGKYRPQLVNELNRELTQSIIRGEDPRKLINKLSEKFKVSKSQSGNLVMTESAFFSSASQKDCFDNLGVEEYEIVATLDLKTSDICQELDGKVFKLSEYEIGITAPPFHNYCRSCTCPHFDDEFTQDEKRIARGPDGKTYEVPSNMKYKEWYQKYVVDEIGQEKADMLKKMNKNVALDKKLYEKYKEVLGKEIPDTFDKFQHMKYNDSERWENAKKKYVLYNKKSTLKNRLDYMIDGDESFIPTNSQIMNVKIIAGQGSNEELRSKQMLSDKFGGDIEKWSKKVGKIESSKYIFDIHWNEYEGSQYIVKIKNRKEKK